MFSNFEEDPIESAGLFEGDIDNVSMDDLQSTDTRVSQGFLKLYPYNESYEKKGYRYILNQVNQLIF